MKPEEQGRYAKLSTNDRWHWHAEVYAFRHVFLGKPKGEPTPCDEDGRWYSEPLVNTKIQNLLERRAAADRLRKERAADINQENERRFALAEAWRKSPEAQLDPAIAGRRRANGSAAA